MPLYGRHGVMRAVPGRRDELLALLRAASENAPAMPGCRLYVVSIVPNDPDAIAVTEIWDDRAMHAASLTIESVRALIARARPLIADMAPAAEFEPVAGVT